MYRYRCMFVVVILELHRRDLDAHAALVVLVLVVLDAVDLRMYIQISCYIICDHITL